MNESAFFEEEPLPDRTLAPLSPWERAEFPELRDPFKWDHHRIRARVRLTDVYSQRRAEEQQLNEALDRNLEKLERGDSADSDGDQSVPPDNHQWLLSEFKTFLERLQDKLDGRDGNATMEPATIKPKPRLQPVRTPRSEAPMTAARPAELLRPEYAKGRLYFSCPCCRFPASLPVWLSGRKARCPRCYSAIRAPHPRKGLNCRSLENDIESVLHPERFRDYRGAHRLIPWLGIPLPKLQPVLHGLAIVLMFGVLAVFATALIGKRYRGGQTEPLRPDFAQLNATDFKARAQKLVEQFMSAGTVDARAALVRNSSRVASLMSEWYHRHPEQLTSGWSEVEASGVGYYTGAAAEPVTRVRVKTTSGEEQFFDVEHGPEGDRIEWESSVGYNPVLEAIKLNESAGKNQTARVLACFDDYYNFNYRNPMAHVCVRLHDPATLEFLGYGYMSVNKENAGALAASLDGANEENMRPLTIEIRTSSDTLQTHQMEIVRMVEAGWRLNSTVADAGNGTSMEVKN